MFKAKETIINWKGDILFILIDRCKPGKDYVINYEKSTDSIYLYTKIGCPDKMFVKNLKTEETIRCIYEKLRKVD